jgi:hypothetical protein
MDNGSFKLNTLYKKFKSWEILTKYVVDIIGMQLYPYLLTKATYPLWTYLMKKFKDKCDWYPMWFHNSMNHGHMLIENVFWSLKNWWCAFWRISIIKLIKVGKSLWHVKFFIIFVNY